MCRWQGPWKVRIVFNAATWGLLCGANDSRLTRFFLRGRLCRGGAKRHRKILRDNIQGITKPAIRAYILVYYGARVLMVCPYPVRPSCSPWWC